MVISSFSGLVIWLTAEDAFVPIILGGSSFVSKWNSVGTVSEALLLQFIHISSQKRSAHEILITLRSETSVSKGVKGWPWQLSDRSWTPALASEQSMFRWCVCGLRDLNFYVRLSLSLRFGIDTLEGFSIICSWNWYTPGWSRVCMYPGRTCLSSKQFSLATPSHRNPIMLKPQVPHVQKRINLPKWQLFMNCHSRRSVSDWQIKVPLCALWPFQIAISCSVTLKAGSEAFVWRCCGDVYIRDCDAPSH